MVLRRLAIAWMCSVLVATAAAEEKPQISWSKDLTAAHAEMVKSKRPLLMYFTTPGCAYCQKMKIETLAAADVVREVEQRYVAVQVDAKKYPELAKQLKLRYYPTTAIVQPTGRVVEVVHGYKAAKPFAKHLTAAKAKLLKVAAKTPTRK